MQSGKAMRSPSYEITKPELRLALDAELGQGLRPIAAGLSAFFAFLAASHALVLSGAAAEAMSAVALATAAAMLGVYLMLHRRPVPAGRAHLIGVIMAGLALLNSFIHLRLVPEPEQTTNVALLVVSVGCFFLSARWLSLVIAAALAGWLAIASAAPPSPAWLHYGFVLLISTVLSALVHTVRVRAFRQLKSVRIQDEWRRAELERELAERKRAEEMLKESERRYRDLVEHSLGLICTHDLDGLLLSINPAAAHALGYEPPEMAGRSLREFLAPSVRHRFGDYLERIQREPASGGLMRVITKEGEERVWSYRNLRYEEEGRPHYVLGHAQDVTERRRGEEMLRESSRRVVNILESITDGFFALDKEWMFTYVNRPAERILRRGRETLLGRNIWEEYVDAVGSIFFEQYHRAMAEQRAVEFETFYEPLDVWVEVHAYPSADGLSVYVRDITERVRAEEESHEAELRFRQLAENIRDVFWVHDPARGEMLYVSPAYEEVWGRPRASLYERPTSFLDAIHPDDRERLRAVVERQLQGQASDEEYRIVTPDGAVRWIRDRAFPIKDEAGQVCRLAGVAEDITEQKQAQAELETFSRRLIEAQESERRRIARELHDQIGQALIAVEINLHAVKLSSADCPLAPQLDDGIRLVDEALQRVRELSHDLRPSLLDDLGFVAALRWYANQQAQRAGFAVEFAADPSRPCLAPEVETACFRIAQEALTNIVRHARARQVWVTVKQCEGELYLMIRDGGAGFDVRVVRKHYAYGEGLGLQGMQERALGVGGSLEIRSRSGQGTEVRVRLPLLTPDSPGREEAQE